MADLATLQTWLMEAELAHHKLRTGTAETEVEHGDMKVRYSNSVTSMEQLAGYIADLGARIRALGGTTSNLPYRAIVLDL